MKRNYFFAGMMALAFPLNVLANINQVSTLLNENGTQWSANDESIKGFFHFAVTFK